MEKSVVAVFDEKKDGQSAFDALIAAGFSRERVRITSSDVGSVKTKTTGSHGGEQSLGDKIADFFGFGDDDETYSEAIRRGSCVVTVDVAGDEEANRAEAALNRFGPVDLDKREAEWQSSGWQRTTPSIDRSTQPLMARGGSSEGTVIPVTEEKLQVGKREVQRGGVRVVSRTVERPVEANVTLREEHATVTRKPVDRAVTDSDAAFKGMTIEVRETAEEAVVAKTARIVEEVVVGKESTTREKTVHDTVRKTEVDVEKLGKTDSKKGQSNL